MLSPYEQPEDSVTSKESESDMSKLLKQLNESYRTILYLRENEGLSYQEIAAVLDMNENQVKVTLHRARNRLHDLAKKQLFNERNEDHDDRME